MPSYVPYLSTVAWEVATSEFRLCEAAEDHRKRLRVPQGPPTPHALPQWM